MIENSAPRGCWTTEDYNEACGFMRRESPPRSPVKIRKCEKGEHNFKSDNIGRCSVCEEARKQCELEKTKIGFGKHAKDTYLFTFENDPEYCKWTRSLVCNEEYSAFGRFQNYLKTKKF